MISLICPRIVVVSLLLVGATFGRNLDSQPQDSRVKRSSHDCPLSTDISQLCPSDDAGCPDGADECSCEVDTRRGKPKDRTIQEGANVDINFSIRVFREWLDEDEEEDDNRDDIYFCHEGTYASQIHAGQALCREGAAGDIYGMSAGRNVTRKTTGSKRRWLAKLVCTPFPQGLDDHCVIEYLGPEVESCEVMNANCFKAKCFTETNCIYTTGSYPMYGQICRGGNGNGDCSLQCFRCLSTGSGQDIWDGSNCLSAESAASADAFWEPHFKTIDGKHFDFQGVCSYYLTRTTETSIIGKYTVCGTHQVTCLTELTIRTGNTEIILGQKQFFQIKINGQIITAQKPYGNRDISYYLASSDFDAVDLWDGFKVLWDRKAELRLFIEPFKQGFIHGLLGNYNGNPDDDMQAPNGTLENDPVKFGNSWLVPGSCGEGVAGAGQDPVLTAEELEKAKEICSVVHSDTFSGCNRTEERDIAYNNCLLDVGTCNHADMSFCLCPSLEEFADNCELIHQGIGSWREGVDQCKEECPAGQTFQMCGDPCMASCAKINSAGAACMQVCVEGCNCPQGQTRDSEGNCIQISDCPSE